MATANFVRVSLHVIDAAAIRVHEFPGCDSGPFVELDLQPAHLIVHDVAVLDALIVQAVVARDALVVMLADRDTLSGAGLDHDAPAFGVAR